MLLLRPHQKPLISLRFDHTGTTSQDEYEFVVRPVRGKAYPERAALRATPKKCRRPLTPAELGEAVAPRNAA